MEFLTRSPQALVLALCVGVQVARCAGTPTVAPRPVASTPIPVPFLECSETALQGVPLTLRDAENVGWNNRVSYILGVMRSVRACEDAPLITGATLRLIRATAQQMLGAWYEASPRRASGIVSGAPGLFQEFSGEVVFERGAQQIAAQLYEVLKPSVTTASQGDARPPLLVLRDAMMLADAAAGRLAIVGGGTDTSALEGAGMDYKLALEREMLAWSAASAQMPLRDVHVGVDRENWLDASSRLQRISEAAYLISVQWNEGEPRRDFRVHAGVYFAEYLSRFAVLPGAMEITFRWPVVFFMENASARAWRDVNLARALGAATLDRNNVRASFFWSRAVMAVNGAIRDTRVVRRGRVIHDAGGDVVDRWGDTFQRTQNHLGEAVVALNAAFTATRDIPTRAREMAMAVLRSDLRATAMSGSPSRQVGDGGLPDQDDGIQHGYASLRLGEVALCMLNRSMFAGSDAMQCSLEDPPVATGCAPATLRPELLTGSSLAADVSQAYQRLFATIQVNRLAPSRSAAGASTIADPTIVRRSTFCHAAQLVSTATLEVALQVSAEGYTYLVELGRDASPPTIRHAFGPAVVLGVRRVEATLRDTTGTAALNDSGGQSFPSPSQDAGARHALRERYCDALTLGQRLCEASYPTPWTSHAPTPQYVYVLYPVVHPGVTREDTEEVQRSCETFHERVAPCDSQDQERERQNLDAGVAPSEDAAARRMRSRDAGRRSRGRVNPDVASVGSSGVDRGASPNSSAPPP